MDKKILVIGNSYMNLRMKINPKKKEGNTVESGAYRFHAFGKSVSTAISIAKLGGSCAFCTKLGADTNGVQLGVAAGVDPHFIHHFRQAGGIAGNDVEAGRPEIRDELDLPFGIACCCRYSVS